MVHNKLHITVAPRILVAISIVRLVTIFPDFSSPNHGEYWLNTIVALDVVVTCCTLEQVHRKYECVSNGRLLR